ncbi:metacaspase-1 [Chaetomium strumarium]|uniref:Metacaspase-1 n=1 Tax=Chaetomium strumarium TaxID=1170767 RepID=A0AAJ0H051_9PEZI|nr:metacaspase-1 [Chaetomium strumarium]
MSYGYPGQGYGPGPGGSGYPYPPGGPPEYGGYGQYPPDQYGQYNPPPNQGYGQYPPPHPQHPHGYQWQPGPPPQGYDGYSDPTARGPEYGGSEPSHDSQRYQPLPQGLQQFGHGAPQEYMFQYSNCTGTRKALLIGINYFNQQGELRGCINDVKNVASFLQERGGYKREDMVILTDDQEDAINQPTKANIIQAMQWLVRDARPNDALFLHYSGHGGQTEDLDGDEQDGYDEVIYPVDFRQNGHITDDEIHFLVVKPLQAGVRLTAVFDSCHSGSVMDLPYVYSTKGVLKEPNLAEEAGQGLLDIAGHLARDDVGSVVSTLFDFAKTAMRGDDAYEQTKKTNTSPADVVMWSGSKDDQTSADATIASQATGAMSWAFINALKKNPHQSYVELLNTIRDELETRDYTQKPQLSCSHPLDTYLLFVW